MLGIPDASIWIVFFLCILSTIACVVYGLLHWNKGAENESSEIMEESKWENADKT